MRKSGLILVAACLVVAWACGSSETSPPVAASNDGGTQGSATSQGSGSGPVDPVANDAGTTDGRSNGDSGVDAAPSCDRNKPFGAAVAVLGINSGKTESHATLTDDELTIYFEARDDIDAGGTNIYTATRPNLTAPFTNVARVAALSGPTGDFTPSITGDGQQIYISRGGDIYTATRGAGAFGSLVAVSTVNASNGSEIEPFIGRGALYFTSNRAGIALRLYRAQGSGTSFSAPVDLTELNVPNGDTVSPVADRADLRIFFASSANATAQDIWTATRASTSQPFDAPAPLTEVNQANADDMPNWISADGCRLYFSSNRVGTAGDLDIWVAARPL